MTEGRGLSRSFRLLELCACEGGATRGLLDAGWTVDAVDLDGAALKRNPADVTIKADALEYLAEHGHEYDAVWASFPCQRWTANGANPAASKYPDLITPGRELLMATGRPWVMENVPKAPLRRDLILHGPMFDLTAVDDDGTLLRLDRHRVFESNVALHLPLGARPVSTPHRCGSRPGVQWAGVYGGARSDKDEARNVRHGGYTPKGEDLQSALLGGVPWMTGKGRRECIPPVYAQHIRAAAARLRQREERSMTEPITGRTHSPPYRMEDQPTPPFDGCRWDYLSRAERALVRLWHLAQKEARHG